MPPVVELTEKEARIASEEAQRRFQRNRDKGIPNRKKGPQNNAITDLNGVMAEIAAAKYLNVWPVTLFDTESRSSADVYLDDGRSVDVKATEYKDGHLLVPQHKKLKDFADVFVLVIIHREGEETKMEVAGWASANELMRDENENYFGHGYVYAIHKDDLRSISKLIQKDHGTN